MALLDFLKRKKQNKKAVKKADKPLHAEKTKKPEKTVAESKPAPKPSRKLSDKGFSFETIKYPHVSEKSTFLSEKNQYVFEIPTKSGKCANKKEIKNAVEGIYGVDVLRVNIIKIPAKKRRLGRIEGFKKGYTKAVVKIKEGQKIEII